MNRAAQLAGQDPNSGAQLLQLFPPFQGQIGPDGPDQGFHDQVCQGLYDVDFLPKCNGPVFLGRQPTYASHFYDPDTGMNWMYSHSWTALVQGRKLYWEALEYYVKGDLATAGYKLGLSLHYLTDLTQPMHAANYTVLSSSDMGYHTAFETYVMQMQSGVSAPTTLQSSPFGGDPGEYFISAAMNSKHTYFADITPASVANAFDSDTGLTSAQCATIQPYIKPILTDAINITAEYLVGWMAMTDNDITLCQLISTNSGYAIDISNSSTSSGAQAQQYTWNNTIAQQFQLLRYTGDYEGYCSIIAKCSGMALDVEGQSMQPNTPVVQNQYSASSDSQKWQIVNIDKATISFQNKNSKLMLTVQSPLQESGSQLIQGTPENSGAQQWQMAAADPVNLVLPGNQLSVDVQNSASGAAPLQIYNKNSTNAQVFLLVPLGGDDAGYYMILSACAGYAISGASQQVMQEQWDSSDAQKWMLAPDPLNGAMVMLQNKASQEFVFAATDGSGQYQSGTALTTSTTGTGFYITPVTSDTAVETTAATASVKAASAAG